MSRNLLFSKPNVTKRFNTIRASGDYSAEVRLKSLRCIAVINILNGDHPFQNDELVFN